MFRRLLVILSLTASLLTPTIASFADDVDESKILEMKRHEVDGDGWLGDTVVA